jgi:hypothetical protein
MDLITAAVVVFCILLGYGLGKNSNDDNKTE